MRKPIGNITIPFSFAFPCNFIFETKWKEKHKEIDKNKLKIPFSHTIHVGYFYVSMRKRFGSFKEYRYAESNSSFMRTMKIM